MPTILDVAREAGVSTATVSRVIQGTTKVLPETKEKVEQAIKQLNYYPNKLAQQFRTQETKNILVVLPELGNTFYSDILAGIESVAKPKNYSILIMETHSDPQAETHCIELLRQKQVDGLITFSASLSRETFKEYASQFPIVIACRYFDDDSLPNVSIDNTKATKDIVEYMLNLGHKRICYLAGPTNIQIYRARLNGYLTALQERGMALDPSLIQNCDSSIQGGYDAMSALLSNAAPDFTAVVASGDIMAVGAIRALNDFKYKVPDDIAVAGFDDIELSTLFSPTLTTVRQPKRQIGIRSMDKLLELIAGKKPKSFRDVLSYELIIRESSGNYIGNRAP